MLPFLPRIATAQWTRVLAVPAVELNSVHATGDTILAGADTAVYVSTNAGGSWQVSSRIGPEVEIVSAVIVRNGRIYAGTYGQGVFVSTNLGATWSPISGGLAGIGSLHINDFAIRGDSLLAATDGAGVFALDVAGAGAGPWQPFGSALVGNQSGSVPELAVGPTGIIARDSGRPGVSGFPAYRVLTAGGGNGLAFWNDQGQPDWAVSPLNNMGLEPGLTPTAVENVGGISWIVGTVFGCYRSSSGEGFWEYVGPSLGQTFETRFAQQGSRLFAAIHKGNQVLFFASFDVGGHWQPLESLVAYVYELAVVDTTLYAARVDGLWKRSVSPISVGDDALPSASLGFALAGANPVRGAARFRFVLPQRGHASLGIFDVQGRRVGRVHEGELDPGPHALEWSPGVLATGIYVARLEAMGRVETARFARIR